MIEKLTSERLGVDDPTAVMSSSSEPFDRALDPFLGLWVDPSGRVLLVRRVGSGVKVSVTESVDGAPYEIKGLVFTSPTIDLEARAQKGDLQVEAGSSNLGPTYLLQYAKGETTTSDDQLLPSVHMGLYDDYDDDLGVPWAFPLQPYRRASAEECDAWIAAHPDLR